MKIIWSALALNLIILPVAAQRLSGDQIEPPESLDNNASPIVRASLTRSSSEQFSISKMTVDNGGQRATSTQYVISGSVGQPEASAKIASAAYRLSGGFWFNHSGVVTPVEVIFADSFEDQQ